MDISFDNLKNFFEKIKELNFWQRIFKWKTIRILSYDAYDEFKKISQKIDGLNQNLGQRDERIVALEKSNEVLKTKVDVGKNLDVTNRGIIDENMAKSVRRGARKHGYDSIDFKSAQPGGTTNTVVFDPKRIKSVEGVK